MRPHDETKRSVKQWDVKPVRYRGVSMKGLDAKLNVLSRLEEVIEGFKQKSGMF